MKRFVIRSKSRFIVSIGIIMIFAMSSLFTLAVSARENQDVLMIPEYVEEGDTLWNMSQKHKGGMDIREYISRVMDQQFAERKFKAWRTFIFPKLQIEYLLFNYKVFNILF